MSQHHKECQFCGCYSEFYCNACHQRMCSKCRDEHLRNPDNIQHEICRYMEKKYKLTSVPCKLHSNHLLVLCCQKCHQAICAICTTTEHVGHGFLDLEKVYKENIKTRLDHIRKIRDEIITRSRVCLQKSKKAIEETKEKVETLQSIMQVQESEIKDLVSAVFKENEQVLHRYKVSAVEKLENQERNVENYLSHMQTLLESYKQSISSSNPVEFMSNITETPIKNLDQIPDETTVSPIIFGVGKLSKDEIRKQFGVLITQED